MSHSAGKFSSTTILIAFSLCFDCNEPNYVSVSLLAISLIDFHKFVQFSHFSESKRQFETTKKHLIYVLYI